MPATNNLIPVKQALDLLLQSVTPNAASLELAVAAAKGHILAERQTAPVSVPAFDNSAMDGFAVNVKDVPTVPITLPIAQTIAAGREGRAHVPGTASRLFTGAPMPTGADAVVIQEEARQEQNTVRILASPRPGQNIRRRGGDVEQGAEIMAAGRRLAAQDLGLLASLGIGRVKVRKPLTVAVIATGNEVIAPGQKLGAGQIYDSNSYALEALLQGLGCDALRLGIVKDNRQEIEAALLTAASKADCLITAGGASVGAEDHVKQAVANLGEMTLWKLAIKPGKPFFHGRVQGKPVFGLPGNPVAVFVTFVMLVRPCLLKIQGASQLFAPRLKVRAGFDAPAGTRQEYLRVRLRLGSDDAQEAMPFGSQGSSILTSLCWADGLAEIPAHAPVEKGQWIDYIPFHGIL